MQVNLGKTPENPLSPSKLNNLARRTIEKHMGSVWLIGEVSDLYMARSGHAYFSLKDNMSSIKCTFFKQYNFSKIEIKNGDNLLAFGQTTLYEERSTFQLKVERIEKSGIGDMAKAFAQLKVKLEALGYFSQEHKQQIPRMVQSLAIVTSQTSAAITDVLNVIKRRNPLLSVSIYHATVQGERAVEDIIDALLRADINNHDVILLTRGGGSQEDLWTFNDISIAQTLFNLTTPCVSAIGHERDTSISDLVADEFAITPTAAAELLTVDISELKLRLSYNIDSLNKYITKNLNDHNQRLDIFYHKLEKSHPKNSITITKHLLNNKYEKLVQLASNQIDIKEHQLSKQKAIINKYNFNLTEKQIKLDFLLNTIKSLQFAHMSDNKHQLDSAVKNLNNLSPLATLSRGYSITLKQNTGEIVTDQQDIKNGDVIETQLKNGNITSQVRM